VEKTSLVAQFILIFLLSTVVHAQQVDTADLVDEPNIEIVIVTGVKSGDDLALRASEVTHPGVDNSDLLRLFPGGNRNSNGPVTRISQYRGMFGAQNNVSIDGLAYTSGGPNWMDSPLSSIPQSLTQSVTLYRGLGSVASIEEGLGGSIEISARKGDFSNSPDWSSFGLAEAGYGHNADSWGAAVYAGVHNQDNWINVAASMDKGDDYEFEGGVVAATEYDRNQYRLGYGHRFSAAEITLGAVVNRTGDSGTPALPMDIRYFDSEQYSFGFDSLIGEGALSLKINALSVEHLMDNFTLRPPPIGRGGMETLRQTFAVADSGGFKLTWARDIRATGLLMGIDGRLEEHVADITDPGKTMFYITNFNEVERDRIGAFAQASWSPGEWDLEAGLRYNRVEMDAGEVGGNLAMMTNPVMANLVMDGAMMPMSQQDRLDALAKAFNESDRNKKDSQWSGMLKASRDLGGSTRLNLGLGRKVRSPSYQERYLWVPMEATAGLADGFTYIGDINLKPETSIELTAGIDWSMGRFQLTPELFYRDVKDYIQGVPSTNPVANMFAIMMSGRAPLQFANVDAELYGIDLGYQFEITASWLLSGNLGYVRGKRTDISDKLYRIAPLSSFMELRYKRVRYFISMESIAAAKQDNVSEYNDEQETPGWGIVNLRGGFKLNGTFDFSLGIENLFDKAYQDHLGGYNRVAGSAVPLRDRLYGKGRNYYLKLNASW
jgi:iron complex outermembrane receptor protein